MPQIKAWSGFPTALRAHLVEPARSQYQPAGSKLAPCLDGKEAEVAEGSSYKDFGTFKLCGEGKHPKTFLLAGQAARGRKL